MNGSIIIFKGTPLDRQSKAISIINGNLIKPVTWENIGKHPDLHLLEKPEDRQSIGIKQVKEGIVFLQQGPLVLPVKVLVIDPAEIMTDDAQNSLLKVLEEPPTYAVILLLSKTENALLPTIQSRCKKIDCESREAKKMETSGDYNWGNFITCDLGGKLGIVEELSKEDRGDVIEVLEKWVREAHEVLRENNADTKTITKMASNIKNISKLISDFENTNAQLRLGLEWLCVNLE